MEAWEGERICCDGLVWWVLALTGLHTLCMSIWQILSICPRIASIYVCRDCEDILTEVRWHIALLDTSPLSRDEPVLSQMHFELPSLLQDVTVWIFTYLFLSFQFLMASTFPVFDFFLALCKEGLLELSLLNERRANSPSTAFYLRLSHKCIIIQASQLRIDWSCKISAGIQKPPP